MSNNDDNTNFGLSRRKMLGGLGVIGIASAGAGLGTTAYFSDSESFQDNTITAGQFELHVTQSTHVVDQDGIGPDQQSFMTALEDATPENGNTLEVLDGFLDIEDAKPGDSYKYCWDICVKHNPGFVEITIDADEWAGNDENNPVHGNSTLSGPIADASGVLGDYTLAVVTLDDQQAGDDLDIVFQGTLSGLVDEFENGGLVHAWEDGDLTKYCHLPCESDVEDAEVSADPDGVEVCVYLYIPSHGDRGTTVEVAGVEFDINDVGENDSDKFDSPGNLIQGAVFTSDVHFAAEQCRHNGSPFDGAYNVSDNSPPPGVIPNSS